MFNYQERQSKLHKRLKRGSKLPFIISSPSDMRYLVGFSGSDGILVANGNGFVFGTDGRYRLQSELEVVADRVIIYGGKKEFVKRVIRKGSNLFFDRDRFPFSLYRLICGSGYKLEPAISPVPRLRQIKDEREVRAIEKAAVLSTTSLLASLQKLDRKSSEKEMAATIEYEMKVRGADGASFPPIVAFGERAALPHASPGKKTLGVSSIALFDFGCRLDGYCSDETVTLLSENGRGKREIRKMFDTVKRASEAALARIRGNVKCQEIDRAARKVIDDNGYGSFFPHSTGHGVGLDVHEPPYLSNRSRGVLLPGMVVTVEPGIYIPGKGGVRLEELVLVTEGGYKKVTYLPKGGGEKITNRKSSDVFYL